ncbi:hypothetical protein E8E13_002544 [Curvularia kusanoi]|uniref:F-box domain-containing protein n=1 Tax=Curvularia kusanoi TaxID=90978 RepID=A0A9P4T4Z8_CURKU|nr:hypothetical protein E8E13_002544 [Curvularia kusanoi]
MEALSLPVDILSLVFDHLTQRDLKKMRLVNRTLHKLVSLRITRVFLSPNRTNIDAFRGIARSDFRTQVREIIWDDAKLEFYERQKLSKFDSLRIREELRSGGGQVALQGKTFQHFIGTIEEQTDDLDEEEAASRMEELWGSSHQEMSLEESFDLYNRLYDEQQAIITSGEDVETLTLGLTSFPNLDRVTISSETWRIKPLFPRFSTPFFRSLPPGFQMPLPWAWLGRDSGDPPEDQLEKLRLPWDDAKEEWRGYQIVISALTTTSHSVKELVIDTNHELTGISYQLFTSEQSIDYTTTVQLFRTVPLTRLELMLNTTTAEETEFSCFHSKSLRTALSYLSSLRHLALGASIDTADDDNLLDVQETWLDIDDILPIDALKLNLRSLELRNFLLYGRSLYSALAALASLSTIQLDCVALSGDFTWRDFWFQAKSDLVWKPDRPTIVFRRKASSPDLRLDSTAELIAFLYGEAECPFTEQVPEVANVGYIVNNWDANYREYMAQSSYMPGSMRLTE